MPPECVLARARARVYVCVCECVWMREHALKNNTVFFYGTISTWNWEIITVMDYSSPPPAENSISHHHVKALSTHNPDLEQKNSWRDWVEVVNDWFESGKRGELDKTGRSERQDTTAVRASWRGTEGRCSGSRGIKRKLVSDKKLGLELLFSPVNSVGLSYCPWRS